MVTMSDYINSGLQGFGMSSGDDLANLNKALSPGYETQHTSMTGGDALRVESLENSLKVLTYTDQHIKLWKKIQKVPAYSTVEEYNQLASYGSEGGGFAPGGVMPETEDSTYARKTAFVKFLGTTREVSHPMTMVRGAHGDVMALENQNGILWLMKKIENALFWGNSKLGVGGNEGVEFDGLDNLIDPENTVDLKNNDMSEGHINWGAQMVLENYGIPSDMFLPFEVMSVFSQQFFPKERVIMPTGQGEYQAGLVVNKFQTHGGQVEFNPDLFLQKTKPLSASASSPKAPTAPASVACGALTGTDGDFAKGVVSVAGTYQYKVTACNRYGESAPTAAASAVFASSDDGVKHVPLTITNAASIAVAPEFFKIYRTEKDGLTFYHIATVPALSVDANAETVINDKNFRLPNTFSAFMGQLDPTVIAFKQLAPLMKMDLAILAPSYRWMILLYGVPILYARKKWMRFINIKANNLAYAGQA